MIDIVFEASIAEVLDEYISDQRLKDALFGQGIIGTFAGPRDKGTASVKLMHFQGDLEGQGPVWGYVRGGMGMISFAIADAAQEAGATLAAGVPVAEIHPGEGVTLEDGTRIRARTVICNADPKVALRLLGDAIPAAYARAARGVGAPQPGREVQRRAQPAPELDGRARRDVPGPRQRRRHDRAWRTPSATSSAPARRARRRVRRDLRADRLRLEPGARRQAPDERVRPVRARTSSTTATGTPAATRWPASSST